jgi:bifunctional enzyme CysN/CysC
VRPGDVVRALPSGRTTRVARLIGFEGDLSEARAGEAPMLTLADEIDLGRATCSRAADDPPEVADQFEGDAVWMRNEPICRAGPTC